MLYGAFVPSTFLKEGITEYDQWQALGDDELHQKRRALQEIYSNFKRHSQPNEATTETDLIVPVLHELGYTAFLPQQTMAKRGRSDVPDYLLFANEDKKQQAVAEPDQYKRFRYGATILEAKAHPVHLDRRSAAAHNRVPSNQILRYLPNAHTFSEYKIRFAILTNGRHWRLYYMGATSKSEEFLEIDLGAVLGEEELGPHILNDDDLKRPDHWLRVFLLMFRNAAFRKEKGKTFQEQVREDGRKWEAQVAEDLRKQVFNTVFPELLKALMEADPQTPAPVTTEYLQELRQNALTFLYRLLFVLYVEDRDLLPASDEKYIDYGMQRDVRMDIIRRIDANDVLSERRTNYYNHLQELFLAIAEGDGTIGVPPYNGGLFKPENAAMLHRAKLPDAQLAPMIDTLSRRFDPKTNTRKWINYRDLSVQQLGSIYEGLLEYTPRLEPGGELVIRPSIFARKTSGSYYTPEELVSLIIENTLEPLVQDKRKAFEAQAEQLPTEPTDAQLSQLQALDPAAAVLELKVVDPAMGSGHFLVSLVDFMADKVLELVDQYEDHRPRYVSPLVARVRSITDRIRSLARENGWKVKEEHLELRQIVRRMILKRCVYGVDKNSMAVELAKVSLWLHTFTVGAPLSFLDHHLRWGDSLFGQWVGETLKDIQKRAKGSFFVQQALENAIQSERIMEAIEHNPDAEISEVEESARQFAEYQRLTRPLDSFLALYQALQWVTGKDKARKKLFGQYLNGSFGNIMAIARGEDLTNGSADAQAFGEMLAEARELVAQEAFLNWEVAFPGVWEGRFWHKPERIGGFDAMVSNPPWENIEFNEIEWFSQREPSVMSTKGAERKDKIKALEKNKPEVWEEYQNSLVRKELMMYQVRKGTDFEYFSKGRPNYYNLFIEKAGILTNPRGMFGLLIPTGITTNKKASKFFQTITTTGRLAHLYDFENKKIFFPEVDSRVKFCAFIAGARERTDLPPARLAFFLHSVQEMFLDEEQTIYDEDRTFQLTAEDFRNVNPNTGTVAIFRNRRDAELTTHIYEEFPILHEHGKEMVWPVKYIRMFDMANDSALFRTAEQLKAEGFYPVERGRWKKKDELYVPLYEGKSIHIYNHRYSNIVGGSKALSNQGQSEKSSINDLQKTDYYTTPRYWIPESEKEKFGHNYVLAFRDIARTTDERTIISTIIPSVAAGHKLPVLSLTGSNKAVQYTLICANLNSFIFDFQARQKVQSTNIALYTLEQLPVIPPETYEQSLNADWETTVGAFVQEHVLRLTYTAWDMQPFAQDLGYEGEPFVWDEEDRRHRMAKLDALYFLLYGLSEEEADYVLRTFPIVQRNDEKAFGRYRTRDLILAYMKALKVGDTQVVVKL